MHVGFLFRFWACRIESLLYLNLLLDSLLTSFPFATPFSQLPLSSPWRQFTSFPLLSPVLFVLPLSLLVPTHLSWLSLDPWALPKFFILFSWFHFQEFCLFLTCPLTICHTFFLLISYSLFFCFTSVSIPPISCHFLSPPSATHATLTVSPLEYIITWISYSLVGKEFFWMILELWIMK